MEVSDLLKVIWQISIKIRRIKCFNSQTIVFGIMKKEVFVLRLENVEHLTRQNWGLEEKRAKQYSEQRKTHEQTQKQSTSVQGLTRR